MFDPWAPDNSVLREKVFEHLFLAEMSRHMLLERRTPFEILRAEFDAFGYDVVVEAHGIMRHIQLKAMRKGGKRASVDVNTRLGEKPGGCVVWMVVDPDTFALGPFHWLGGAPGCALPSLGDRIARHSKGTSQGVKNARPGQRKVLKGRFLKLCSVAELADAMFGAKPKLNA